MADEDREQQAYECFNAAFEGAVDGSAEYASVRSEHPTFTFPAPTGDWGCVTHVLPLDPFGRAVEVDEQMAAQFAFEAELAMIDERARVRLCRLYGLSMLGEKDEDELDPVLSREMEHAPR